MWILKITFVHKIILFYYMHLRLQTLEKYLSNKMKVGKVSKFNVFNGVQILETILSLS